MDPLGDMNTHVFLPGYFKAQQLPSARTQVSTKDKMASNAGYWGLLAGLRVVGYLDL